MVPFERAIVVSLALHCDHCTISNHSTTICHPMSLTLKLTVGRLWVKTWGGRDWPM